MPNRKYLLKPDRPDERDLIYCPEKVSHGETLPVSVDLRSKCSPVVDQGNLGSCTANAIASGLREYLEPTPGDPRLSRLFLYYQERLIEGTVDQDSGAEIRDGMKTLKNIGVCPESEDPYDISTFTNPPSEKDIADAAQYKIAAYHRVKDLNGLKLALANGQPVVLGIAVYESFEFDEAAKTGVIPMPKRGEQVLGGHAVLVVGYDDTKGWVIVRNSWGEGWGDKGYFYLKYQVFEKLVTDMWTGK